MVRFCSNLFCVVLNSFAGGWAFMEGNIGWGIANLLCASLNATTIILQYRNRR